MDGPQTHALATQLNERLSAHQVERLELPEGRWQANVLLLNCTGQVIQQVRARGTWLFFDFSHGVTWACHLLARSSWHLAEASQERPPRPARRTPLLTVHLRGGVTATLTGRPIFLILPTDTLHQHRELRHMGPDPLTDEAFVSLAAPRLRQAASRTLASALLDQEIVAGVGNAMKCELLYTLRLSPATRIGTLLASQVEHVAESIVPLAQEAYQLARQGKRWRYHVYDRAGEGCPRCRTSIAVDRTGCDGHWSWYCPSCQPLPEEAGLF